MYSLRSRKDYEKLEGEILAPYAMNSMESKGREYEEEEHIEGDEAPDHRAVQHQKSNTQILDALVDGAEGYDGRDGHRECAQEHRECAQEHHPQAESVESDVVTNT